MAEHEHQDRIIRVYFVDTLSTEANIDVQVNSATIRLRKTLNSGQRRQLSELAIAFADSHFGVEGIQAAWFDHRWNEPVAIAHGHNDPASGWLWESTVLHPEAFI